MRGGRGIAAPSPADRLEPEHIPAAIGGAAARVGAAAQAGAASAAPPLRGGAAAGEALPWARLRRAGANVARTVRVLWRASPGGTLLIAALTLASALLPLFTMKLLQRLIDVVVAALRDGRAPESLAGPLALDLGLLLAVMLGGHVVYQIQRTVQKSLGDEVTLRLNLDILEKARRVDYASFDDSRFHDRLQRAQREASIRPAMLVQVIIDLGWNAVVVLSFSILIAGAHWSIPAALALGAVPASCVAVRFGAQRFQVLNWHTPEGRRMTYLGGLMTDPRAAKEIRLLGLTDHLVQRYRSIFDKVHAEEMRVERRRAVRGIQSEAARVSAYLYAFTALIWAIFAGTISLGAFVVFSQVVARTQNLLDGVFRSGADIFEHSIFLSDLFAFLALPEPRRPTGRSPAPRDASVVAEGVSFAYPSTGKRALERVSFRVHSGEKVAIVGCNGAGKTTLVKLIAGLYAPTRGSLRLGGVPAHEIDPATMSEHLAVTFQDFVQYWLTLRENIGFGHLPSLDDMRAIQEAARRAGAEGIAAQLAGGYESRLGTIWEGGHELSQGQWQKLALARAFLRPARILILDEPTSALDPRAETELMQTFLSLSEGRTTIFISHRIGTARLADRILVMMNGALVEEGPHDALIARGGEYARLFQLQARWYT
ncbi:ABC transporter ATP-binding protein [Sorangium sp. So ce1024]|uniref:ABC transporter ATP-binding protein n=1 Tax=Sorangium sp. So ce1024 TaxID=3133327 RepID=UPI003F0A342A